MEVKRCYTIFSTDLCETRGMASKVRLCNPFDFKYVFEYDGNKFTGILSSIFMGVLESIGKGSNVTFEMRSGDGIGEEINGTNGRYSGCIGRLQANLSDAMLQLANYPIPVSNISQGLVMMDTTIQFINAYYPRNDERQEAQIESSFSSFHLSVWILSLFTLLLCAHLLHLYKMLMNKCHSKFLLIEPTSEESDDHLFYETVTHMTQRGQLSNSTGLFRKILFAVLSLFSFLVIFYLSSIIKTELVVIPRPETMRSYREMLDNECGIYFMDGEDTYLSFKFAPEGSEARQLWQLTTSKFPMDIVRYTLNPHTAKGLVKPILSRKLSMITDTYWAPYHMQLLCTLSWDEVRLAAISDFMNFTIKPRSVFPLVSRDDNAAARLKGFISRSPSDGPLKKMEPTIRRVLEAGIPVAVTKLVEKVDQLSTTPIPVKKSATAGDIEQCTQNVLYMPEVHLEGVKMNNLKNLPNFVICVLSLQVFVLVVEMSVASIRVRKSTRRVAPIVDSRDGQLFSHGRKQPR